MKKFLSFSLHRIAKKERAAIFLAALFESVCILLAAFSLARLIDGLPSVAGQYAALLAAALVLQAVSGAWERELLADWSGRVRLAYRRELHGMLRRAVRQNGSQEIHQNSSQEVDPAGNPGINLNIRHDINEAPGQEGCCDRLAELCCEHVEALDEFFQKVIPLAVTGAVRLPLFLAVFFYLDAVSGLIAVVTMPVAPVLLYLLGRMTARASAAQWDRQSELNSGFYELMQGVVTLKLFRRTEAALREMEVLSQSYSASSLQVLRIAFLSAFAVELITTLAIAVLAVGIGLRILSGNLDFFTGFFVLLLAPEFFMPIRSAGMAFHVVMDTRTALLDMEAGLGQYGKSWAGRHAESAATQADRLIAAQAGNLAVTQSDKLLAAQDDNLVVVQASNLIVHDKLSMAQNSNLFAHDKLSVAQRNKSAVSQYNKMDMEQCRGILPETPDEIVVPSGSFAVITGSSGAGKTTLLKRMAGLLPSGGARFLVAGYSLESLPDSLRHQVIGYVPQEPHVYAASLRDNLLLGRNFSDACLEEVLALAGLDSWYRLSGGLDSLLGDGGAALSNGQRHRLGLARALLGRPPVLLLDEVTAGLEEQEERKLLDTLLGELAGTTILLATHRHQAIRRAAQVIEVIP
ncbi:ABC transporter ATP-binding protein/permease [Anaerovibrio sp.]|uniref:ABC transporter ATP-binding protein/permease n=1 Tax=Anaerovibrio sp. TaxID=1872532 RepID=UPI003F14128A